MKPGDKVVRVSGMFWHKPYPEKGDIVTVEFTELKHGDIYLALVEYNYDMPDGGRVIFRAECFRPIDYTYGKEVCEKLEKELSETLIPESV